MNEHDPTETTDGYDGYDGYDDYGDEPSRPHGTEDERSTWRSGRHPVDVGQLVMGVAFLGLVGVWALLGTDAVGGRDVRWLLPLPWLLAGTAGLLAVALGSRRRRAR